MNKHSSMTRVMIDVPFLFTGTRGQGERSTHLTFLDAGDTHTLLEILGKTDDGVELGRTSCNSISPLRTKRGVRCVLLNAG